MLNLKKIVWICLSLVALTACGGGNGSNSQPTTGVDGDDSQPVAGENTSLMFSVSLSSADIRRVSNGDQVTVDITGISSGELTFIQ